MATILPFPAWRYNLEQVSIQQVATQPYDKITPAMQEGYYQASPYNLVRIILGKRFEADTASENVYSRAAKSFQTWRQTGILRQDSAPAVYRYSQTFAVPGSQTSAERSGFIALGNIEEYSEKVVFRHEQTLSKPKADRLDLLRATRAHFGQIFMLYNGAGSVDAALSSASANSEPDIELTDEYGVIHRVWKISDPAVVASVQDKMRDRKLIIADGHHRYETAVAYRNERRQSATAANSAASEYLMMTFVDMDCPGLVILPTHRVVFGLPAATLDQFPITVQNFFCAEDVDADIDALRATEILKRASAKGTALLAVMKDRAYLLHTPKAIGSPVFGDLSVQQQHLDVVQLHKCLLESCLQISEEAIRNQQNVHYIREAAEAINEVRSGKAQIAFLMNPVRMEQVRDIAFAGEVLPQKSTDFYPKLLDGLTIYALE